MSATPQPINVTEDSSTDRALIRMALDKLEKDMVSHAIDDKTVQGQLLAGMDQLNRYASQLRVILAILALCLGGLFISAKWVVGHMVTDQLIQFNLIEYQRTTGGLQP